MTNATPQHPVDDLVERLNACHDYAMKHLAPDLQPAESDPPPHSIYAEAAARISQLEAGLKAAETRARSQPSGEASADAEVFAGLDAEEPAACRLRWAVERAMLRAGFVHPTGIDDQERQKFQFDLVAAFKSAAAPATTSVSEGSLVLGGEGSSVARADMTPPSGASDCQRKSEGGEP